jgi:hypothetical protein
MRIAKLLGAGGLAVMLLIYATPGAISQAMAQNVVSPGKNCRMEQQCHWENFKKVCVWVKVCR